MVSGYLEASGGGKCGRIMFPRPHRRNKDGKHHTCWSLVETVRTPEVRVRKLSAVRALKSSAQTRWLKTVEVFNEQGDARQLRLFRSMWGRRWTIRR
jgi:hypothetical protein